MPKRPRNFARQPKPLSRRVEIHNEVDFVWWQPEDERHLLRDAALRLTIIRIRFLNVLIRRPCPHSAFTATLSKTKS